MKAFRENQIEQIGDKVILFGKEKIIFIKWVYMRKLLWTFGSNYKLLSGKHKVDSALAKLIDT